MPTAPDAVLPPVSTAPPTAPAAVLAPAAGAEAPGAPDAVLAPTSSAEPPDAPEGILGLILHGVYDTDFATLTDTDGAALTN